MKKICLNCIFFECLDTEGGFLEKGFCLLKPIEKKDGKPPLFVEVDDEDTCDNFEPCEKRRRDLNEL